MEPYFYMKYLLTMLKNGQWNIMWSLPKVNQTKSKRAMFSNILIETSQLVVEYFNDDFESVMNLHQK